MNIRKMMMVGLFAATAMVSLSAAAYDGSQYAGEAKITLNEARAIALKTYPGTVVEQELEHKLGGSGLRFSFDIRAHHITHEVGIDAKTGAVLANGRDSDE